MCARKLSSVWVAAVLSCTAGCYEKSVVGTSGQPAEAKETPSHPIPAAPPASAGKPPVASMPKPPSVIAAKPGENVGLANPWLGDVNGDGFDDFLITALVVSERAISGDEDTLAYLYYGRPDFPAQLSTADADAVFQTNTFYSGPLGDIDGDGLADFVLARFGASEIVFGSRQKLHGSYMPFTVGTRWDAEPLPELFDKRSAQMVMRGIGDVNDDGFDDLVITGADVVPPEEASAVDTFGLRIRAYLVPGHAGAWPNATWDRSQAIAEFGYQRVETDIETFEQILTPIALGDLDADGIDDIGAAAAEGLLVFYGGRQWSGVIGPKQADAHLVANSPVVISIGDADGDGASDLAALSTDGASIHVYYGGRWSGERSTPADLELRIAGESLEGSLSASAGDINSDGWPEILVASAPFGAGSELDAMKMPAGSMYLLRGTGTRQTGRRFLDSSSLFMRGPATWSPQQFGENAGFGWILNMNGDVDGDGGNDILTSTMSISAGASPTSAVYLIPSTPRTPD